MELSLCSLVEILGTAAIIGTGITSGSRSGSRSGSGSGSDFISGSSIGTGTTTTGSGSGSGFASGSSIGTGTISGSFCFISNGPVKFYSFVWSVPMPSRIRHNFCIINLFHLFFICKLLKITENSGVKEMPLAG